MKMTMDDANNIMDTLLDEDKTLTIDQQVDGSVVVDMGKFLVAYANATYVYTNNPQFVYTNNPQSYKKQNQDVLTAMKSEYQRMKGEAQ